MNDTEQGIVAVVRAVSPAGAMDRPVDRPMDQETKRPAQVATARLAASPPAVLRLGDAEVGALAAAAGMVVGACVAVVLGGLSAHDYPWARMFSLESALGIVPLAMTAMLGAGLGICAMRWMRLGALQRISSAETLASVSALAADSDGNLDVLLESLRGPLAAASPLLRRVRAVVRQWQVHPDLGAAMGLVEQHALADEETIRRGYGSVRTLVWALPVLGLIGTVVGIATSVADFSSFLGTKVDDVTAIKQSLINVTGGLAFAFAVTILGLGASLVLMLPATTLQAREERFFARLQAVVSEVFLPQLQSQCPVRRSADPFGGSNVREAVAEAARDMVQTIAATLQQTGSALLTDLATSVESIRAASEQAVAGVRADAGALSVAMTTTVQAIDDAIGRHAARLATAQESLADALRVQSEHAAGISTSVAELAADVQRTVEAQRAVQTGVAALAGLPAAMEATARAVVGLGGAHAAANAAATNLAASTERVLDAQSTLQQAMSELETAGLSRALAATGERLEKVAELLQAFQSPIVLQAVPVRVAAQTQPTANQQGT